MTFEINNKTLMISGYKGDTASFTFQFNEDISNSTVCFIVKKNVNDLEEKAVLKKEFISPTAQAIQLKLTESDTLKLGTPNSSFKDYYWSLKIKANNDFVQTLIPNAYEASPIFRVYP